MSGKLFVCPGCGSGKIAPNKCRADDVRRYCLSCSKATGRLVRRVVPSRVSKIARKKRARAERKDAARLKAAVAALAAAAARSEAPPSMLAAEPTDLERRLAATLARCLSWWPWLNDVQRAGVGERLVANAGSVLGAGILDALALVPRLPRVADVATFALAPVGRALRSGRARPAAVRRAVLDEIGTVTAVALAVRSVQP